MTYLFCYFHISDPRARALTLKIDPSLDPLLANFPVGRQCGPRKRRGPAEKIVRTAFLHSDKRRKKMKTVLVTEMEIIFLLGM